MRPPTRPWRRPRRSGDDGAVATALVAQALVCAAEGDRNGNRRYYDLALARAERGGDVLTELRILNNLGSLETEEGRCLSALTYLDRALARCDEEGPVPLAAALAQLNRAEALLGLGRAEEALAELDVARATYRELDAPLLGQVLVTIGDTNRIRGHAALATAAYREAVETVAATGSAQVLVPALSGLARTCVVDDPDEARRFLAAALAQPGALGTVAAVLAAGWLALVDGDEAEAEAQARSAEREAGRRHDLPRLAEALELRALAQVRRLAGAPSADVVDRLAEAAAIWAEIENPIGLAVNQVLTGRLTKDAGAEQLARQRLLTLGVRDDAARVAGPLMALEALAATGIRVRSLGTFAVLRDGHPVPTSAWQSRKTRDLLKLLVGRTGGLTRDALAEHLWPGQSGTGGRLSTVLSTLRSVLDPERRHPPDRYLVADRASVRLDRSTVDGGRRRVPRGGALRADAGPRRRGRRRPRRRSQVWSARRPATPATTSRATTRRGPARRGSSSAPSPTRYGASSHGCCWTGTGPTPPSPGWWAWSPTTRTTRRRTGRWSPR